MGPNLSRLRLLIVEDQPDAALTLAAAVELWGYEAAYTTTPAQAIADALHHCPDVIISDIGLPEMDGCALAEELLAVTGTLSGRRPLLVAVSGQGDEVEERCRAAGFHHFFRKPADLDALKVLLDSFAERMRSASGV